MYHYYNDKYSFLIHAYKENDTASSLTKQFWSTKMTNVNKSKIYAFADNLLFSKKMKRN